jgi:hypothetical protein
MPSPSGATRPGKARGFEDASHTRAIVGFRQRAVVADRRRPARRGRADCDVADLPIRGEIAEQHEVADGVSQRLLMQRGLEDAGVEPRRRRGIGHNDVEVLEAQILEWERGA